MYSTILFAYCISIISKLVYFSCVSLPSSSSVSLNILLSSQPLFMCARSNERCACIYWIVIHFLVCIMDTNKNVSGCNILSPRQYFQPPLKCTFVEPKSQIVTLEFPVHMKKDRSKEWTKWWFRKRKEENNKIHVLAQSSSLIFIFIFVVIEG